MTPKRSVLTLVLALATAVGAWAPPVPVAAGDGPPETRRDDVVEVIHGTEVADPYRWLEPADDPEVQAWMQAQDDHGRRHLDALPHRTALAERLQPLYYTDAVSVPGEHGGRLFYARTPADSERTTVVVRSADDGPERTVIDADALAADGSLALKGWSPSRDGRHLAYGVAEHNADATTLRIRAVDGGDDLPAVIDRVTSASVSWTPDSSGFYYTWLPPDPGLTREERQARAEVRFHTLGDDPATDRVVQPALGDPSVSAYAYSSWDGRFVFLGVHHGSRNDLWFQDTTTEAAGFQPLAVGRDALYRVDAHGGDLFVFTTEDAPRGRVFRVAPARPDRDHWDEIIPETDDATLERASLVGGHLALTYLRRATSTLELRTLDGRTVRTVALPGLGTASGVSGNPDSDTAWFTFQSFTDQRQIFRLSVRSGEAKRWRLDTRPPAATDHLVTEQVWYRSADGTGVSMFLVHAGDLRRDGERPVLLTGYGGFGISWTPGFSPAAVTWAEHGGVFAVPNLRGGGEYGEEWHHAGRREHKQNTFDDFVAAAEHLISQGYTRPERIAIRGASNGGLLVGAAMTQRPDLFGAVVCEVPLLDMIRYHRFGAGQFWIDEYGSPDDPDGFKVLHGYSPYHRVERGTGYPALLMLSADADDRVDPLHARKFLAAVQWASTSERPVWLRIEREAGHGGGDSRRQHLDTQVDALAFMLSELGVPSGG